MNISNSASALRPVLILAGVLVLCFAGMSYPGYFPAEPSTPVLSYQTAQIPAKDGYQGVTLYAYTAVQESEKEDERPVNADHMTMLCVTLFGATLALLVARGLFCRRGAILSSVLRLRSPFFIYAGSQRRSPALLEIFRL